MVFNLNQTLGSYPKEGNLNILNYGEKLEIQHSALKSELFNDAEVYISNIVLELVI
jgi:hypothetical protein